MQTRELAVTGAFEFVPPAFPDNRGTFACPYTEDAFTAAVGHPFRLAQSNHSVSRRDVIRGVHWADVPPSQAKYVYCPSGALLDVVVDIRVGSPTFGQWDAVRLDGGTLNAVYVPEGLGHAFVALTDDTVMSYLCSTGYNPGGEHGLNPLDPELGLPWAEHLDGREPVLSDKDRAAPTLAAARADGLLPNYADCLKLYEELRVRSGA